LLFQVSFDGIILLGVAYPILELFLGDSVFTLKECIISGFSVSAGDDEGKKRPSLSSSISLNFTGISQSTTSIFRRPISVPIELKNSTGISQPHVEFRAIGAVIFSHLSQADLWNVARTCILWLHCASSPMLLKESAHTWSYEMYTSATTLDGFRLPKMVKKSDRDNNDDDNNTNNENDAEKAEEKAKEELEQSIIREDLKKAPFAFLFENQ